VADVSITISGSADQFNAAMEQAKAKAAEAADNISSRIKGIGDSFRAVQDAVTGFVAVLAAGKIGEQLNQLAERAEQIRVSADAFGVTTTQMQGLQAAAIQSGVESDNLSRAMAELQSRMAQAGEEGGETAARFNALGITTEQLRNPAFNVIDAMTQMGAATNSNAAIMAELGTRGARLLPLLRELASDHDLVADSAQKVGALTEQQISVLDAYHATVAIAGQQWENFASRIGLQVVPAIATLLRNLGAIPASAQNAANGVGPLQRAIDFVAESIFAFIGQMQDVAVAITAPIRTTIDLLKGLGTTVKDVVSGNFAVAFADMRSAAIQTKDDWQAMFDSFKDNAAEAQRRLDSFKASEDALRNTPPPSAAGRDVGSLLPDLSTGKSMAEQMFEIENELAQRVQQTMKQAQAQITADAQSAAEEQETAQVASIDRQIEAVQKLASEHRISSQQELQQTIQLLNQKWAAEQAYYSKAEALQANDLQKLDALNKQEEKAYEAHMQALQKANETYTEQIEKQWQSMTNTVTNAFTSFADNMIKGTKTIGQSFQQLALQIVESMVNALIKLVAQWAAQHLLALAMNKQEAASNAAVAATGAGKSAAQIPYIGWILAIGAMASTFAAAKGYSAAEGFDIPSGLNPLTQLHSREMVLPAPIADTVRNAMTQGGAGGGETHNYGGIENLNVGYPGIHEMVKSPQGTRAVLNAAMGRYRSGWRPG